MKILQANKYLFQFRGAERYISELFKLLNVKGHEIIPFSMRHERNGEFEYQRRHEEYFVRTIDYDTTRRTGALPHKLSVGLKLIYSFEAKAKIDKLISFTKPDIAHLHNIYYQLTPSILPVIRRYNIPAVMTVHDYTLLCPSHFLFSGKSVCERCKTHRFYNAVFGKCVKRSSSVSLLSCVEMYFHRIRKIYEKNIDLFITPSDFIKSKLIEWGMDESRLIKLPYCINLDTYHQYEGPSEPYILYMGALSREKGVDVLINAMSRVNSLELRIVGSGDEEKRLKTIVSKMGLTNLRFLGYKNGEELKKVLQQSMFVVVPSICYDNSPLVIFESMAMGKPVVAARIGGIPELVVDKSTGLLFEAGNPDDLAEKIAILSSDRTMMSEMGQEARLRIEREYAPEVHYDKLLKIYQYLMTGKISCL